MNTYRFKEILSLVGEQQRRIDFMAELDAYISELNDQQTSRDYSFFANHFLQYITTEELTGMKLENIYGVIVHSWQIFSSRAPRGIGENPVINVFHPHEDKKTWPGQNTVIIIQHLDIAFITDSVITEISHQNLTLNFIQNFVVSVRRNVDGTLIDFKPSSDADCAHAEVLIYIEVNLLSHGEIAELVKNLQLVLRDVDTITHDINAMFEAVTQVKDTLNQCTPEWLQEKNIETIKFLQWMLQGNFIFFGYKFFHLHPASDADKNRTDAKDSLQSSSLGLYKNHEYLSAQELPHPLKKLQAFIHEPSILKFSKVGFRARILKSAYPDNIIIKKFDASGNMIGIDSFVGLFEPRVYTDNLDNMPILHHRLDNIYKRAYLTEAGFNRRVLAQVLATIPRDEMLQTTEDQLFDWALSIAGKHERRQTQVYFRESDNELFFSFLVYTPRELYTTKLRLKIEQILLHELQAKDLTFNSIFSESILVRTHYVIFVGVKNRVEFDMSRVIERIHNAGYNWNQELRDRLNQKFHQNRAIFLQNRFETAFPVSYQENESTWAAVQDILRMEKMSAKLNITTRMYYQSIGDKDFLKIKIFHVGSPLPLSKMLPLLENMRFYILEETAYRIQRSGADLITIHDIKIDHNKLLDLKTLGDYFTNSFINIWNGVAENDLFNALVLSAKISWKQVTIFRAYARYIKQIRTGFSQSFIASTLLKYPRTVNLLLDYFNLLLNPSVTPISAEEQESKEEDLRANILIAIEEVTSRNEDQLLRRYLNIIDATIRTNFFQPEKPNRNHLAFKIRSDKIINIPLPTIPLEVFVYSPIMEGIHLRGGKIARGGLRWSDRLEDYRTEILGLVKAQQVKNAIITPVGAKGGFIVKPRASKQMPDKTPYEIGVECYKIFISGLLDITDNISGNEIIPPENVKRRDHDDPYLVIAADKGTSSFSDIGNNLAISQKFWLGDAFASGGSQGYDHKKMGITARGTWVSVHQHFLELGIGQDKQPVTVIGIGDMSGDVFGNGMLESNSLLLVAAFNHQHIFIDPNPQCEESHAERKRLFQLKNSTWMNYNQDLISSGGGVFLRQAKTIRISKEMQQRFNINANTLSPDELIQACLTTPVDMIWNGGIGTFVRASTQSNYDCDDRHNDNIRITAKMLNCKVFAEGGNLGMTQAARIEYALAGGGLNTDFIDNSAGVDCSDHEVNIKIFLQHLISKGLLKPDERVELLTSMTDSVAELVLINNFRQVQALSIASLHSLKNIPEYMRCINLMEELQGLNRSLEGLPSDEIFYERQQSEAGLTRPELAVMLSHAKNFLKQKLVDTMLIMDSVVINLSKKAFPAELMRRYGDFVSEHPLYRNIAATQIANDLVNQMGCNFVMNLLEYSGNLESHVRAWLIAKTAFDTDKIWQKIETLPEQIPVAAKIKIMLEIEQLLKRATHWLIFHQNNKLDLNDHITFYQPQVRILRQKWRDFYGNAYSNQEQNLNQWLLEQGIAKNIAADIMVTAGASDALAIIETANKHHADLITTAEVFSQILQKLGLESIVARMYQMPTDNHWQYMEIDTIYSEFLSGVNHLCDLFYIQNDASELQDLNVLINQWLTSLPDFMPSWQQIHTDFKRSINIDIALLSMVQRRLTRLITRLTP